MKTSKFYSISLYLSAIIIPIYFTDFRFYLGGTIFRLSDLLSIILVVFFYICHKNNMVKIFVPKGFLVLLIFILYCFINSLIQSGILKSLIATFQWKLIITTLVIIYSFSVMNRKEFLRSLLLGFIIVCMLTILYHFSIGKFYHYKSLGDAKYSLGLTGVILLACIYIHRSYKLTYILLFLYLFILLSLERKGILAFHMVLLLYAISICGRYMLILLSVVLLALLTTILSNPEVIHYFELWTFEYSDHEMMFLDEELAQYISNLHRQSLLLNGIDIFFDNFLFGVGAKMLPYHMIDYYFNPDLGIYTHNVFLDILIEYGAIGLTILLSPYLTFIFRTKFNNIRELICFSGLCLYSIVMIMFMSGGAPSMIILFLPITLSNAIIFNSPNTLNN